ncbi:hypothetical protein EK904_008798 [Melospiza melodia maxima]|nr:hypothetical protein EK904_008798 [Melospiza melodia maxima]
MFRVRDTLCMSVHRRGLGREPLLTLKSSTFFIPSTQQIATANSIADPIIYVLVSENVRKDCYRSLRRLKLNTSKPNSSTDRNTDNIKLETLKESEEEGQIAEEFCSSSRTWLLTAPARQSTGDSSRKMYMQTTRPQDFHSLKSNLNEKHQ